MNMQTLVFLVNGEVKHIEYGDAVVSRANETHVCIYEKLKEHKYYCLWIDAPKSSHLYSFFDSDDFSSFYSFAEEDKKDLAKLFKYLYSIRDKKDVDLEIASTLLSILAIFKRNNNKELKSSDVPREFQNLIGHINNNFSTILTVKDISNCTNYSEAALYRMFKKYIGSSPKKYLESIKLSYAAKLLKSGSSFTDACFESGFADCSYFIVVLMNYTIKCNTWKKRFGITPNKYKGLK